MTTGQTTQKDGGTKSAPRQRSSLLYAIPVLALIIVVALIMSGPNSSTGSVRPLAQLQTEDFHSLAFSQIDPNTVFFGHHDGLLVSHDIGGTWLPAQLQGADAMALGTSAANAQRMYVAGHGIFYRSDDSGKNWVKVNTALQGADIHGLAVSSTDANHLYAYVVGEGIRTSSDGGATWGAPLPNTPEPMRAMVGGPDQTLYVGSQGIILRSNDGGQQWQRENIGDVDITSLSYDPVSGTVYAGAVMTGMNQGLLYRRSSATNQWESLPITGLGIPLALAIDSQDTKTLILLTHTGALYRSRDGGLTWNG